PASHRGVSALPVEDRKGDLGAFGDAVRERAGDGGPVAVDTEDGDDAGGGRHRGDPGGAAGREEGFGPDAAAGETGQGNSPPAGGRGCQDGSELEARGRNGRPRAR